MMFFEKKPDLLSMLPERLRGVAELSAVCDAAGSEIDLGNRLIARAADDSYIKTAGAEGLHRWESILGVSSPLNSTLEARREALIAKLMTKPPINLAVLKGIIEAYMGVEVELSVEGYIIYVRYRGRLRIADLTPLFKTVYDAVPADMLLDISYRHLVWRELDSLGLSFEAVDAMAMGWDHFEKGEWTDG